jgi:uncharacterized alpha-E superfamily protein
MLCRVADSLFWMSRYIERAENTASVVNVHLQLLLDAGNSSEDLWRPYLESSGDLALYTKAYGQLDDDRVLHFLCFDRDNPSSLLSCVMSARENARMIRDQIATEMWEVINRLYHHLRNHTHTLGDSGLYELFRDVQETAHLFMGLTESTFPHEVGYEFIKMGRFIERADTTCRLLDTPVFTQPEALPVNERLRYHSAILKATRAASAYRQRYKSELKTANIQQLLILSRDFPRSLLFCLSELQAAMHAVSGCAVLYYSNEAERLCGRLIAQVNYTSSAEWQSRGLSPFLDSVKEELSALTLALNDQYMFFPVVDPALETL